jgi:hypothetical protein
MEGANAFIDCIIAYSKNLETNTVSADLEVCNSIVTRLGPVL